MATQLPYGVAPTSRLCTNSWRPPRWPVPYASVALVVMVTVPAQISPLVCRAMASAKLGIVVGSFATSQRRPSTTTNRTCPVSLGNTTGRSGKPATGGAGSTARKVAEHDAAGQEQDHGQEKQQTAHGASSLVARNGGSGHAHPSLPLSLTYLHHTCIHICMRTTLNIDEPALRRAAELTGIREKTALVRLGLEALIARESAKRLALLGGTERRASAPRRRRPRG